MNRNSKGAEFALGMGLVGRIVIYYSTLGELALGCEYQKAVNGVNAGIIHTELCRYSASATLLFLKRLRRTVQKPVREVANWLVGGGRWSREFQGRSRSSARCTVAVFYRMMLDSESSKVRTSGTTFALVRMTSVGARNPALEIVSLDRHLLVSLSKGYVPT